MMRELIEKLTSFFYIHSKAILQNYVSGTFITRFYIFVNKLNEFERNEKSICVLASSNHKKKQQPKNG